MKSVEPQHSYAYITEANNIESNKDSKILKIIVPENQNQTTDISRNNLNLVPNNKNNIYNRREGIQLTIVCSST